MTENNGGARCPYCGARLQENALFCLYCMRELKEKTALDAPKMKAKRGKKKLLIALIAVVTAAAVAVTAILLHGREKTYSGKEAIVVFPLFLTTSMIVTKRLECEDLWDPSTQKDAVTVGSIGAVRYFADIFIPDATGGLVLFDKGDQAFFAVLDVTEETFPDAQRLIICAADAMMNSYSDIDDIVTNENVYPRREHTKPYSEDCAAAFNRTAQYDAEIADGAQIGTVITGGYTDSESLATGREHKVLWVYVVTTRDYGERVLYDLSFNIEYADDE